MRTRALVAPLFVVVASATSACLFDGALDEDARIRCAGLADCPDGQACGVDGLCAPQAELDAPLPALRDVRVTLSPAPEGDALVAMPGAVVTLAHDVAGALDGAPRARVTIGGEALSMEPVDVPDSAHGHRVTLPEDAADGVAPLDVSLPGTARRSVDERAASITVDGTPPAIVSVVFDPPVARDGQRVLARVVLSEPVRDGAQLVTLGPVTKIGPEDGVIAVADAGSGAAGVVRFAFDCPQSNGIALDFEVRGLVDRAGNAADATSVGPLEIDVTPPDAPVLEVLSGPFASAVPPFDEVRIEVTLPDDAVNALITFRDEPLLCGFGVNDPVVACSRTITEADAEGPAAIVVIAVDAVGNTSASGASVTLDHTAPDIVPGTVTLELRPPPDQPRTSVAALGQGGELVLSFGVDEIGATVSAVRTDAGDAFILDSAVGQFQRWRLTPALAPALASGSHAVEVVVVDAAGNAAVRAMPFSISVDLEAPSAPDVDTPGQVVFARAPWGTRARETPYGAVRASGLEPDARLFILDDSDDDDTLLGIGDVDAAGAITVELSSPLDRDGVRVQVVDAAGNASAARRVRDVEWTAALNGRVAGATYPNPHLIVDRGADGPGMRAFTEMERSGEGVALTDGAPLALALDGEWIEQRAGANVGQGDSAAALVYDPVHDRLVSFGNCPQFCNDTVVWDPRHGAWGEVDGPAPASRSYAGIAFDAARDVVLLAGGLGPGELTVEDTWELDGDEWKPSAASAYPDNVVSLAFDPILGAVIGDRGYDTVAYIDGEWTRVSGHPDPFHAWVMATDPARGVVVGVSAATPPKTYEWDGSAWNHVPTSQAPMLAAGGWSEAGRFALAYDAAAQCVLAIGPTSWCFDGTDWTQRNLAGTPMGGVPNTCVYASAPPRERVYARCADDSIYELVGDTWRTVRPRPVLPAVTGAVLVPTDDGMLLFGEQRTWTYEEDGGWRLHTSAVNPPLDATIGRASDGTVFALGGCVAQPAPCYARDLYAWTGDAWITVAEQQPGLGAPDFSGWSYPIVAQSGGWIVHPSGFYSPLLTANGAGGVWWEAWSGPPAGLDGVGARLVSTGFGVRLLGSTAGLVQAWQGGPWSVVETTPAPSSQSALAVAELDHGEVLVFGGFDNDPWRYTDETWFYDGETWSEARTATRPPTRADAALARIGGTDDVILLGGNPSPYFYGLARDDAWRFTRAVRPALELRFAVDSARIPPTAAVGGLTLGLDATALSSAGDAIDVTAWSRCAARFVPLAAVVDDDEFRCLGGRDAALIVRIAPAGTAADGRATLDVDGVDLTVHYRR